MPIYAEIRIGPLMPSGELCRVEFGIRVGWRGSGEIARHNQSASRKASSVSGGRYRPGVLLGGVVRASARSLICMSAWR
jgi:hypothetical protein